MTFRLEDYCGVTLRNLDKERISSFSSPSFDYKDFYVQFTRNNNTITTIVGWAWQGKNKDGSSFLEFYLPHLGSFIDSKECKILGRSVSKEDRLSAENLMLRIKNKKLKAEVRRQNECSAMHSAMHNKLSTFESTISRFEELLKSAPEDLNIGLTSSDKNTRRLTELLFKLGYYGEDKESRLENTYISIIQKKIRELIYKRDK